MTVLPLSLDFFPSRMHKSHPSPVIRDFLVAFVFNFRIHIAMSSQLPLFEVYFIIRSPCPSTRPGLLVFDPRLLLFTLFP